MNGGLLAARAFFVLVGPYTGDFVATFAVAWPRLPTPFMGRSHCGRCGAPIGIGGLIPVVTWLWNRSRRRCCGGRIPIAYPLGEIAGLVVGIAAAAAAQPVLQMWTFAVGLTLTYTALVDLRRFNIPAVGLAALCVEAMLAVAVSPSMEGRLARLAAGGTLALAFAVTHRFSGRGLRRGLGGRGLVLAGLLGTLVGWRLAAPMTSLAAMAPLALQLITRKWGPIPFSFWFSVAAALSLLAVESNLLVE